MVRIEECRSCRKPFKITGGHTGPMIEREYINCPYCNALWGSERIADTFSTHKLTPVEAAEHADSKSRLC